MYFITQLIKFTDKRLSVIFLFQMNIFVARLSYQTTEEQLDQLFQKYGEVASAKIIFDRYEGRSKGYGFVEMPNDDEALDAINALNDTEFDGRQIVVKQARPKEDNSRD